MMMRNSLRVGARQARVRVNMGLVTATPVRHLNIHEFQSSDLMAEFGVNVPPGIPVTTVEEAVKAAKEIGDDEVVIKSQILAGGRGLGTFKSGLQGGVHVIKSDEVCALRRTIARPRLAQCVFAAPAVMSLFACGYACGGWLMAGGRVGGGRAAAAVGRGVCD